MNYSWEGWIKFALGSVMLILSLGYLYRPSLILKINAWARHFVFNDSHVLHYRRRWGLLFFFAAGLFLYSSFNHLATATKSQSSASETSHP